MQAGVASVSIAPPAGVDLVGFLRRSEPARRTAHTMEATALVLDDGATRLVLAGADLIGFPGEWGRTVRARVAAAAGCPEAHVLLNGQHTHAAPPLPGMLKLGGDAELSALEAAHADAMVERIAGAAATAAAGLRPATIGAARTELDGLSVNRRQRTPEGTTILGWNPDEACDRDVAVLRVDGEDGAAIATVVAFACHPVVVGPEVPEASPDYVGPLRDRVRAWTGGDCLFLQGCAGNILPLEAFIDHPGSEVAFGDRLALAALAARERAEARPTRVEQAPYASAVPIALWRRVPDGEPPEATLAAAERTVDLRLDPPPSREEIVAIREDLERRANALREAGAPRSEWNPLVLHTAWAQAVEDRIDAIETEVPALVQALRIGPVVITAWPCEPFCELGLEVRERSPAAFPITLGYSNDLVGYVATRAEIPHGGYEPASSQRHFGRPSPYAPGAAEALVDAALELTDEVSTSAARR